MLIRLLLTLCALLSAASWSQTINMGDIFVPAKSMATRYSDNQPIALISTPVLYKDNGLKARGEQTFTLSVASSASIPVRALGVNIAPGQTKELTYDVDASSGRLHFAIYPANNDVGNAQFELNLATITGEYCPTGYTENPSNCTKLMVQPVSFTCETNWVLNSSQRTCTYTAETPKDVECPDGWTFSSANNTCSTTDTQPAVQKCPSTYQQDAIYGCIEPTPSISKPAQKKCFSNEYYPLHDSDKCHRRIYQNGYCPDKYIDITGYCEIAEWELYVTQGPVASRSELNNCAPGYVKRWYADHYCLSEPTTKEFEYHPCPDGYFNYNRQPGPYCYSHTDTRDYYLQCPDADNYSSTNHRETTTGDTCYYQRYVPVTYQCPEGSLQGSNCVVTETQPAQPAGCPAGYTDVGGGMCEKKTVKTAATQCPTNYTYVSVRDRCEYTDTKPHL